MLYTCHYPGMRAQTAFLAAGVMSTRARPSKPNSVSSKRRKIVSGTAGMSLASSAQEAPDALNISNEVLRVEKHMSDELDKLSFGSPVTNTYNPLKYAWEAHKWYVEKFGNSKRDVLLVGTTFLIVNYCRF